MIFKCWIKISFIIGTPAMQVWYREFSEILAARFRGDALVTTRREPAVHFQRRWHRRLHPGELSPRWRPLCPGADRAETGLFSRVSFRRELTPSKTAEGQKGGEDASLACWGRDRVSRQLPYYCAVYLVSRLCIYRPISFITLITYSKLVPCDAKLF